MAEINNLTGFKIKKRHLEKIANLILLKEKKRKLDLSVALVTSQRIKELNKKYRKKDLTTDVLSFSYDGSGEVVICPRVVKKNARISNKKFEKELAETLIHGILHLLGYEHEKMLKEAEKMEKRQKYYLNLFK